MKTYLLEPYKLFFPLGFLLGAWGILIWIFFIIWGIPYPGLIHSNLMIGGFLTSFTTGFLMTAVPRFTGSFHAEVYEIGISVTSFLILFLFGSQSVLICALSILFTHLNLLIFFLRRFLKRKVSLPETFIFIPLSLVISIIGQVLIILSILGWIDQSHYALGRILGFSAFMLGLVLGVGSKLIPMFNGFGPVKARTRWITLLIPVLFFSSFFIQHFFSVSWGLFVRLISILYVAIFNWSLCRRPLNPSRLSYGLWFSCWGIVIGSIGALFMPSALIHWSHIIYVLGFGLMTLMIGSRVILSHGGFDLSKEGEHIYMVFIIICLFFASLVRLSLHFFPQYLNELILGSSFFWLLGLVFWWIHIGSKLFRKVESVRNNHVRQS